MEQLYMHKKENIAHEAKSFPENSTATPAMPNSFLLAMQNNQSGNKHNPELESIMKSRLAAFRHQIPSAENEADKFSAGITSGTPEQVKQFMGKRLGADFSSVRFHTGESVSQKADNMGARAWTQGNDVYFGEGGFHPTVAAHELVHTAQQGAVGNATVNVSAPMGEVQMCKKPNGNDKDRNKHQRDEEEKQQEPIEQQEHSAFEELYADEVDNDAADEGHCAHKCSDLNDYKHPNDLTHTKGRNKHQRDEEEKQQEPIEQQEHSAFEELYTDEVDNDAADEGHCAHKCSDLNDYKHPNDLTHTKGRNKHQRDEEEKQQEPIEQQEHSAFEELYTDENDKSKTLRELMEEDEDSEEDAEYRKEDADNERIERAKWGLKLHAENFKKKRLEAQNRHLDRRLYRINEHWSPMQPDESIDDSESSNEEFKESNNQAKNEDWERSAFEEEKKSNESDENSTQKKR